MADSLLHHIVVVGGGAGGLELATRLGNGLGKSGRARVTLVARRAARFEALARELGDGARVVVHDLAHEPASVLDQAERSVALLTGVDADGNPVVALFDATATAAPEPTPTPVKPAQASAVHRKRRVDPVQGEDEGSIPL